MANGGGSMISRRRLGIELKRLREQAHLSMDEVARRLDDLSQPKVSRLERGQTQRPRIGDVRAMLELYGVTGEEAEALLDLARGSRQKGWWQAYSDLLPEWFHAYVGLEAEAAQVANFEPQLVPGLLQTEDYARVLARTVPGITENDVERQVAVKIARQQALTRDQPLKLWAIVDEAVLRRPFGDTQTMRAQLDHLTKVARMPNVVLQVLPFNVGTHPAIYGAFAILSFPDLADTDVVYLDARGGLYLDEPDDIEWYTQMFNLLRAKAADPDRTFALITNAAKELP